MNSAYSRILIVQTAFLGDVILITPLIRATGEAFPDAEIDALVIPQTVSALKNNPYLTRIIPFGKRENKLAAFTHVRRLVASRRYDLALTPHGSATTALLLSFGNIKRRIGFAGGIGSLLHSETVPFPETGHRIMKNLKLLQRVVPGEYPMQTALYPDGKDSQKADILLGGLRKNNRLVALAPGSVWATKQWRKEHYVTLTRLLHEAGYSLVFIGGKDERTLCDEIVRTAGVPALNLAGQTDVLESAAVINRCDLLISNDSGAMHIANAMRTDVFAFFGPTVRGFGYYPYRERDRVLEIDLPCRPCAKHGGATCPLGHHDCMWKIEPAAVAAEVHAHFTADV
jgi:heptosyltransferase II